MPATRQIKPSKYASQQDHAHTCYHKPSPVGAGDKHDDNRFRNDIITGDAVYQITTPKVKIISAVGAGDSFVAAFVLGMANDEAIKAASRYAVAAAASAMTTAGTELCRRADTELYLESVEVSVF